MNIRLGPIREEHRDFLFDLRCNTMKEYIHRTWGWDEIWQRVDFNNRFNPDEQRLILLEDAPVGFVHVQRNPDHFYIADIQVLPEYQGRGIGAAVIRSVLSEARSHGLPVTLQVLQVNRRARLLYERLGFRATGEAPCYILMRA